MHFDGITLEEHRARARELRLGRLFPEVLGVRARLHPVRVDDRLTIVVGSHIEVAIEQTRHRMFPRTMRELVACPAMTTPRVRRVLGAAPYLCNRVGLSCHDLEARGRERRCLEGIHRLWLASRLRAVVLVLG